MLLLILPFHLSSAKQCETDIILGIDSSACYRDEWSRMIGFLKKLATLIGRSDELYYGTDGSRLGVIEVSTHSVVASDLWYQKWGGL